MMRVIRIIQYEGEEQLVKKQVAASMSIGEHNPGNGIKITIRGYGGFWDYLKFLIFGK